jgi:hypothetical protein
VSTADIAILAITALGLANVAKDYRVQMRVADRLRIVNPVKQPEAPKQEADVKPAAEQAKPRAVAM